MLMNEIACLKYKHFDNGFGAISACPFWQRRMGMKEIENDLLKSAEARDGKIVAGHHQTVFK